MYGTVARMRTKPGGLEEIRALSESWGREDAPDVAGFVASYVFQGDQDPNECWLVAIFEDRDSYTANAGRPEQDAWYRQIREHLEEDPVWHDGEIVYSLQGARPEPTG